MKIQYIEILDEVRKLEVIIKNNSSIGTIINQSNIINKLCTNLKVDIKTLEIIIHKKLINLNITPNLLGYNYLKEAIILCYLNNSYLNNITKQLYPKISKKFNATPSNVERAIRHCIELCFDKTNDEFLKELFGYSISPTNGKLSNSVFIAILVEVITFEI